MPERIEITKMKQNRANREYVLENVKQEGALIEFASEELRDDKEVVLKAVNAKPLIVKYASLRLRQDIDVAKAAIGKAKNKVVDFFPPEILENEEIKAILTAE